MIDFHGAVRMREIPLHSFSAHNCLFPYDYNGHCRIECIQSSGVVHQRGVGGGLIPVYHCCPSGGQARGKHCLNGWHVGPVGWK